MKDQALHSLVRAWDPIFEKKVGNELGMTFRGRRPHKPELAYDIVHMNSLMIYTDLIE